MIHSKKNVTVWCKEARFQVKGATLQQRLAIALKKQKKAASRREQIGDKEFRFINDHWESSGIQFGIAFCYEQDKSALLVSEDDEAEVIKLQEMVPPKDGERKRQFLEGMLYFMVFNNHVLIVQSSSFRVQAFEDHLVWLMNKTGVLSHGQSFGLADQILSVTRKRIRDAHVKDVTITSPLVTETEVGDAPEKKTSQGVKQMVLKGFGIGLLEKVAPDFLKGNRLKDAIDTNIECSLNIRYKYSISNQGQTLLDDIAVTLRNVEGADAVIHLDDGTTITGDKLRLTGRFSVRTTNGVINYNHLFEQMQDWLQNQISSGNLTA